MENCIELLANKYPQLLMPIKAGIKDSEEYKDVVLRGKPCPYKETFIKDNKDTLERILTPVGEVDVLSLRIREDFIHAVRALGNRCEPVDIPDSTGAMAIFGLNNWEKVKEGLEDYKDSIIILSAGNYSNVTNIDVKNVTNGEVNLTQEEWIDKSITIRKYHELTHFVMRKKYPEDIKPIRDELIADIVGLIAAFGYFDDRLLKLFLGIENETYRLGGRLENYEGGSEENIPLVLEEIRLLKEAFKGYSSIEAIYENIESFMSC